MKSHIDYEKLSGYYQACSSVVDKKIAKDKSLLMRLEESANSAFSVRIRKF